MPTSENLEMIFHSKAVWSCQLWPKQVPEAEC